MKKILMIFTFMIASIMLLGCSDKPSAQELSDAGYLLDDAMDEFNDLKDNYLYKLDRRQLNGTDIYDFQLIKLYQGNVYAQMGYYHTDLGWKNEDRILTNYSDLTDIPYDVYAMHSDGSSRHYYKFKYFDTDDNFQKLYQDMNSDQTPIFGYDYTIFKTDMFKNYYDHNAGMSNEWRVKDDLLIDSDYKGRFSEAFHMGLDGDAYVLNYVYLYVNDSLITQIQYGYSYDSVGIHYSYYVVLDIERSNYEFDLGSVTSGFEAYQNLD